MKHWSEHKWRTFKSIKISGSIFWCDIIGKSCHQTGWMQQKQEKWQCFQAAFLCSARWCLYCRYDVTLVSAFFMMTHVSVTKIKCCFTTPLTTECGDGWGQRAERQNWWHAPNTRSYSIWPRWDHKHVIRTSCRFCRTLSHGLVIVQSSDVQSHWHQSLVLANKWIWLSSQSHAVIGRC